MHQKAQGIKNVQKGKFGYLKAQRKKQILITAVLYAAPLLLFFTGLWQTGTRKNWFTMIAVVGCLPACKWTVNVIMLFLQKPLSREVYEKIVPHEGTLTTAYELTFTAYEKNTSVAAIAICGNEVIAYTEDPKADTTFLEKHITNILLQNNFYGVHVKVVKDLKRYLERMDSFNKRADELRKGIKFVPDQKYPELSREELMCHTMMAISL
ncbi:MAG: hypothetical protein SO016_13505 [Lachnospiraceae bacterium]|nr:hypothetical protein [Robinsoniella sp.]MDY3767682.1 hypothetical protein [Lachnospiraceae bacterium]